MPDTLESPLNIWRRIASWWDARIGEGNDFQRTLIMPATDRLLDLQPGQRVLDACCGNGNYSRHLAGAGARVVAFDGAEDFIAAAKQHPAPGGGSVDYRVIDATDEAAIRGIADQPFDAAVCSMAMMDLPALSPLLNAIHFLLGPGGRFVFSVSHPCFASNEPTMTAALQSDDGQMQQVFGLSILRYLSPTTRRSAGIVNQPELHWMYHRPMSMLLSECFQAGFVLDAMEEPAFSASSGGNPFSWSKRPEIPPALVCRLRKQGYL